MDGIQVKYYEGTKQTAEKGKKNGTFFIIIQMVI